MRVVVSINGVKFRLPIMDKSATVGWLCDNVADRYIRHHKLEPASVTIREIRGSDGSVLCEMDAVCEIADDMEELVGIISTSRHTESSRGSCPADQAGQDARMEKDAAGGLVATVPEPPIGGVPMGLSSHQHHSKWKRVQEVP